MISSRATLRAKLALGLASTAITLGGAVATAASADIEEVTVTARRREESLLEVPVAITAVTAEQIEKSNLKDLKSLSAFAPSFYVTEVGGGRQDRNYVNLVFRGMQFFTATGLNDPALIFVDGAPVISGQLATFQNVERVEVLPGPQTATFGRNTYTGAINIVTRKPGNEWAGNVRADVDEKGSSDIAGSIEGPLVENTMAFRLAANSRRYVGSWRNNFNGGTLGDRGTDAASLTLVANPSDAVAIKLFGEYSRFSDGPGASFDAAGNIDGNCNIVGTPAIDYWCGSVNLNKLAATNAAATTRIDTLFRTQVMDKYSIFGTRKIARGPGLGAINLKSHAILDWDLPWQNVSFQAIAAYHDTDLQTVDEATRENLSNNPCVPTATTPCVRSFYLWQTMFERTFNDRSLEFRLTSDQERALRWTFGANYVKVDGQTGNIAQDAPPAFGGLRFSTNQGRTKIETQGLFGGLYGDVSPQFTLGAEVRSQSDKVTSIPFGLNTQLRNTFKSTSGRLSVQFKPTENLNVFANLSNGFRPGTFNNRLLTLPANVVAQLTALGVTLAVDEEEIQQFELGVRGVFLDGKLQGSLVGYTGKLKDQQIQNFTLVNNNGAPTTISYVGNTGKSDIHGIEFDGRLRLTDTLALSATGSWNVLTVKAAYCGNCSVFGGDPAKAQIGKTLPWNPEKKGSLALDYNAPLAGDRQFFSRLEYLYEGTKYADELELAGTGARNLINARVGVRKGPLTVELYGTNLTNDLTPVLLQRSNEIPSLYALGLIQSLAEKRRIGVRAAYDF